MNVIKLAAVSNWFIAIGYKTSFVKFKNIDINEPTPPAFLTLEGLLKVYSS